MIGQGASDPVREMEEFEKKFQGQVFGGEAGLFKVEPEASVWYHLHVRVVIRGMTRPAKVCAIFDGGRILRRIHTLPSVRVGVGNVKFFDRDLSNQEQFVLIPIPQA